MGRPKRDSGNGEGVRGIKIDEVDQKILEQLAVDGRLPATHIAREVSRSAQTVQSRIDKLKEAGVLGGLKINAQAIGRQALGIEAYVTLDFAEIEGGALLLEHAVENSTIEGAAILLGDPDTLIRVRGSTVEDIDRTVRGLRASGLIAASNMMLVAEHVPRLPLIIP